MSTKPSAGLMADSPSLPTVFSRRTFIAAAGVAIGGTALSDALHPLNAFAQNEVELQLGEEVERPNYTFVIEGYKWASRLETQPDSTGTYHYYDGEDNKHYFIFSGTMKNISDREISPHDTATASFLFNDKYTYDGEIAVAASGEFIAQSIDGIDPLETVELYVYALVPDEIMETFDTVDLTLSFDPSQSTVYTLSYSQAQADEKAEEEQKAAEGTPLDALVLDGIRVDLADDLYAFQLEGQQGYAWTADGAYTTVIEKGEGYEIPDSATDRQTFFAQRIADYAAGQGWSVTRSEPMELADKLEGYLNCVDRGDGNSVSYVNIPLSSSDFIQVYAIYPSDSTASSNVPEHLAAAIRLQDDDDPVAMASNATTTLEAAGITFESPVSSSQGLSYNALYAFDYDRTLQIMVEPFNGVDIAGHMVNTTEDAMSSDPATPEYFDAYCQQFASARNGWIMSKFSTGGDGCTVSVCTIRAENQEVGSVVYTLASTPATMEGTTYQRAILIARCRLSSGRKWSPSIDAMIASIASTGVGKLTDYNFKRSYGWQITMPDYYEILSPTSMHDSVMWLDMYQSDSSTCLLMTMTTMVAGYGYYYEFSVIGDTDLEKVQVISEETRDTAGASVLVRKGSEDSNGSRTIVADIHSSTNNALGLDFTYDPEDEEFLMPSINQVIDSIIVG